MPAARRCMPSRPVPLGSRFLQSVTLKPVNSHDRHAAGEPGFMKRRFWQSLIAVLAGNAIYFGTVRYLPLRAQHRIYQMDWELAADFLICLMCYGLVRLIR